MNEALFMGIDGGGSKLRIAIVNADLHPLCSISGEAANPNTVGRAAAQAVIRRGIADALDQACIQPRDIAALAIGIAGASNLHSEDWLIETVRPVLPASLLVPSSDLEIALVGALGQRHGILLLAGTGSAVYGSAQGGARLQIGGWGYLLGDDGSGYWLGLQLLRRVTAQFDEGLSSEDDPLTLICLDELGLKKPRELVAWLYRAEETPPQANRKPGRTRPGVGDKRHQSSGFQQQMGKGPCGIGGGAPGPPGRSDALPSELAGRVRGLRWRLAR